MQLFLVHHGEAVPAGDDPRQPLTAEGRRAVQGLADRAASKQVSPAVVWHSGKLRARQTAEIFWRTCNALAEFSATRDVQPGDPPAWLQDRLRGESRDVLVASHFPYLPRLLGALLGLPHDAPFPRHGLVALESHDEGASWKEQWRLE